jgi:hypothetical protein
MHAQKSLALTLSLARFFPHNIKFVVVVSDDDDDIIIFFVVVT